MKRSDQNQALKDLDALVELVSSDDFRDTMRHVIMRGRFSSGQRIHQKDELGATKPTHVDMTGTPAPSVGDPTGEEACWAEAPDPTGKTIMKMADSLSKWLAMAKWIQHLSSIDVVERAERTVPLCDACGDPILGAPRKGLDAKCAVRWSRYAKERADPSKVMFIAMVKHERDESMLQSSDTSDD
jgi:hypothetical protein